MERDYNKYSHPNWAKFIDGKLDLPTAFWGFLVGGSIFLLQFLLYLCMSDSQGKITYTFMGIYILINCNRVWMCASKYSKEKVKKINQLYGVVNSMCLCVACNFYYRIYMIFMRINVEK